MPHRGEIVIDKILLSHGFFLTPLPFLFFFRWCGIAMEFLGAGIVFFSSLFASLERSTLSAGLAGLSVSYSQQVSCSGHIKIFH